VKPDIVEPVMTENKHLVLADKIIVSIAAGVSIGLIEGYIGSDKSKVIRVMPNALCSIRESSSVYCVNARITESDELVVQNLFKNVGLMMKITEKLINVFSGFSGAGPAYVYLFAEALIDGALLNGVPFVQAREFAIQTLYGSAKLLMKKKDPYAMKYQITTPGGITIAGINALEQNNFRYAVMQAITQAKKKGDDMDELKLKYLKPKF
jgi:pyrroline-5-carboxylate reductase